MFNTTRWRSLAAGLRPRRAWLLFGVILGFALAGFSHQSEAFTCSGELSDTTRIGGQPEDMLVASLCLVTGTSIKLGQVNIVKGGKLVFVEPASSDTPTGQDFWASSIIIENGGEMLAGVDYTRLNPTTQREEIVETKPYGTNEKTLRIHLYGEDPGMGAMGALCKSPADTMPWDRVHGLRDPPKKRRRKRHVGLQRKDRCYASGEHAGARLQGPLLQIRQPARRRRNGRCAKGGPFRQQGPGPVVRWHPEAAWQKGYVRHPRSCRHRRQGNGRNCHIAEESRHPDR